MILRKKYLYRIKQSLEVMNWVFLVGTRQVGKTTLMKMFAEQYLPPNSQSFYINFDEIALGGKIAFASLKEFEEFLKLHYQIDIAKIDWFLMDEIKNVKNFNLLLKALIDKYPQKKFLATSSGNYTRVKEIVEGLAGRVVEIEVYPLDWEEFLTFKNHDIPQTITPLIWQQLEPLLREYMSFGGFPAVVLAPLSSKKLVMKSILDSVITKDIRNFLKEWEVIQLQKLFEYLAQNTGSKFSYEGIANWLWLKKNVVKKFLSLLEASYLISFLPPFFTDKKKELSSKQKVYVNDFGVVNYFLQTFNLKSFINGKDVEMFVFLQLLFNKGIEHQIYFYQNINNFEIDFILKKNSKLIPIEVKAGDQRPLPKIFLSFCKKYKEMVAYFVQTTKTQQEQREFAQDCLLQKIPYIKVADVLRDEI